MRKDVLIIGIGNEIRQDDGIGPYCVRLLKEAASHEKNKLVDYMVAHQLDVIHCDVFANYGLIVVIDADALDNPESVRIEEIRPEPKPHYFTSHIGSVADILSMTQSLYGVTPKTFLVAIKGSSFEVGSDLSEVALENTPKAAKLIDELTDKFLPLG